MLLLCCAVENAPQPNWSDSDSHIANSWVFTLPKYVPWLGDRVCRIMCDVLGVTGSWSASTSPARSPSPSHHHIHMPRSGGYGTTSLEQRSRSPSPRTQRHQHSYPVLVPRRGQGTSHTLYHAITQTQINKISFLLTLWSLSPLLGWAWCCSSLNICRESIICSRLA